MYMYIYIYIYICICMEGPRQGAQFPMPHARGENQEQFMSTYSKRRRIKPERDSGENRGLQPVIRACWIASHHLLLPYD